MFAEVIIDDWEPIHKFLSSLSMYSYPWIFRGHADTKWPLSTSIEREASYLKIRNPQLLPVIERIMLETFQSVAHLYLKYIPDSSDRLEWMSILQHHGGVTRLLDFTYSFYIALFFALNGSHSDASVWCISTYNLYVSLVELLTPMKMQLIGAGVYDINGNSTLLANYFLNQQDSINDAVIAVRPNKLNQRMAAQQGLFLLPTNLNTSFVDNLCCLYGVNKMEFKQLTLLDDCDAYYAIKLIIPQARHEEIRRDLYRMNITAASLFPGLDGYAQSLRDLKNLLDLRPER